MRFFVSYSRSVKEELKPIIDLLRAANHEVWWDVDIPEMADWWATILDKIEWCEVCIFVVSEKSVQSPYCLTELRYATDRNCPILPFVIDDHTRYIIPPEVTPMRNQWFVYNGDPAWTLKRIGDACKQIHWERYGNMPAARPPEPNKGSGSLTKEFHQAVNLAENGHFEEAVRRFRNLASLDYREWGDECQRWVTRLQLYAQIAELAEHSATFTRARKKWGDFLNTYGAEFDPFNMQDKLTDPSNIIQLPNRSFPTRRFTELAAIAAVVLLILGGAGLLFNQSAKQPNVISPTTIVAVVPSNTPLKPISKQPTLTLTKSLIPSTDTLLPPTTTPTATPPFTRTPLPPTATPSFTDTLPPSTKTPTALSTSTPFPPTQTQLVPTETPIPISTSTLTNTPVQPTLAATDTPLPSPLPYKVINQSNANQVQLLAILSGHRGPVFSVAFSPDGQFLASGSSDTVVIIWNLKTGKQQMELKGHQDAVYSVAFDPTGKLLASGSADGTVRIWDVSSGTQKLVIKSHSISDGRHGGLGVRGVAFSPDGKMVAASGDQAVKLWDIQTGELRATFSHPNGVNSVAFSPDGKTLASGNLDTSISMWNVDAPTQPSKVFKGTQGLGIFYSQVSFSFDGNLLAALGIGGNSFIIAEIRDLSTGTLHTLEENSLGSLAFGPISSFIVTGSGSYNNSGSTTIQFWTSETGHQIASVATGGYGIVQTISVSNQGDMIALYNSIDKAGLYTWVV